MSEALSIDAGGRRLRPVALRLSHSAVEALKWLGLVLMTLDHVNKYIFDDTVPVLFALGRLAMPIFAIVLGYNLARSNVGAYWRVAARLAAFGALASVPFISLGGLAWGWWPLNIMATLLVATTICGLLEAGGAARIVLAIAVFIVGGSSVEFWWPGVALCVAAWRYARSPSWGTLAAGAVALVLLHFVNGNDWALATPIIVIAAAFWRWPIPRYRLLFYAYYPLHLGALWLLQARA